MIERCFPEVTSSVYAELALSLKEAISLLENRPKKSKREITLSATELEILYRVLQECKTVYEKYSNAAVHIHGLLEIIDKAGNLYRADERGKAAMTMCWTLGKRPKREQIADIFVNYLLLVNLYKKDEWKAIEILKERYSIQSEGAVIQHLKRTLKIIKKTNPAFHVLIPSIKPY